MGFSSPQVTETRSKSRGEAEWFGRNFLSRVVRKNSYSHFRSDSNHIVENYKQQSNTYWKYQISFFYYYFCFCILLIFFCQIEAINMHFFYFSIFFHFLLFFLSNWRNHYANPRWQPYFNIYHVNTLTCASKSQYFTCEVLTFTGTCESKSQYSTCEVLTFTVTMDLHDELFYG